MNCLSRFSCASFLLCAASHSFGGTFTNNFDNGTPPGSTLYGNAVIESTGGVDNSGVLKLTKAVGSQSSSYILDDLDAGATVYGFDMNFKVRIDGGGTPADGFSVNFAPDLPQGPFGESGAGNGLTVVFDIYINNPPETSRSIQLKNGGAVFASRNLSLEEITTGTNFVDARIHLNANGSMDVFFKGAPVFTNVFVPNFQGTPGQFGFGGRTGGAFANQFIDNLGISTVLQPQTGISVPPTSLTVRQGEDAVFSAQITYPEGAKFQWFKGGTAIAGATNNTYTVAAVTAVDNGTKYKVQVTGANNTVTSDEVTLSVVDIPLPATPTLSFDFNDGNTPTGTALSGLAAVSTTGGVGDSGVLRITDALNDQRGGFVVENPSPTAPVYGFTARFDALIGGGTEVPADGYSFNFASDIPDDASANGDLENGVGSGLTVGFDIYDNGGGEAPSVDVRYGGNLIVSQKVPLSAITTGTTFSEVIIRLESDGTLDVAFGGNVIINNLAVPGFSSITGGRFALVGRTGGLNANMWFDNIEITPSLTAGDLRITTQPNSLLVASGAPASFSVSLNDTNGATYQWFKGSNTVQGATSATLQIASAALADSGSSYTVQVKKGNLTVTSAPATLTVADISNPTVSFDFNNGQTPAGTALAATPADTTDAGYISTTGGVNDSGVLHLTDAVNGLAASFVINPVFGGAEITAVTAVFDVRIGGGTTPPADGMSFNFAPDLPNAPSGAAEDGLGTGLSVGFDIFDNGNETPPAPSVDVRYKGVIIASTNLSSADIQTGDAFRPVVIRLSQDGKVDVAYGDRYLFSGLQLTNYTPVSNGKFGFFARTGGLNANQWVDNIRIQATRSTAALRIVTEPADALALPNQTATFTVAVSDPNGVTYAWSRNGSPIAGATSATYTTPPLALSDSGAQFTVAATGPSGTATSRAAVATVVAPITVTNPNISFDFETGQIPDGTFLNANAASQGVAGVIAGGGTNGSVLQLTSAAGGENASFIIPAPTADPVSGFTAHFQVHIANGSGTPADGMGFVWGDLAQDALFGETGAGSGLVVSFDTYQNVGEQAPAIQINYGGTIVTRKLVPYSFLSTGGDAFADVAIRVEADGTLDLQYKNNAVFNNLQLPGYTVSTNASFGFGARTGGEFEEHWIDNVQIATSTGSAAPTMTITRSATGVITISWTGAGTLQSRDNLNTGTTWAPVTGASNPYTVTNDRATRFFRISQ